MKKNKLFLVAMIISLNLPSQVVLNEVIFGGGPAVELKNIGSTEVNTASYFLCSYPTYTQIQNATVLSGSTLMTPGSILVVSGHSFSDSDGELGLYLNASFSSSASILDYVEWGSTGHQRSTVAIGAGIWTTGDFVSLGTGVGSIEYDGTGDTSSDWLYAVGNTQGEENSNVEGCDASAFMIGNASRCEGETASFNVVFTGEAPWTLVYSLNGSNQPSIVTSNSLYQLVVSEAGMYQLTSVTDANCEGVASGSATLTINPLPTATLFGDGFVCGNGPGELEIALTGTGPWSLEYHIDGVPQGSIEVSSNPYLFPSNFEGEYNAVMVEDQFCEGTVSGSVIVSFNPVDGGQLDFSDSQEETLTLCVDDSESDLISWITQGVVGEESVLLITDELDQITEILTGSSHEFEGSTAGTAQLWNLAYTLGIEGLTVGSEVPDQLIGCFSLSTPLTVIKQTGSDCVTSSQESFAKAEFTLYPNPVIDQLNVSFPDDQLEKFSAGILDTQGRSIKAEVHVMTTGSQVKIDTSTLDDGLYMLRLKHSSGEEVLLPFIK